MLNCRTACDEELLIMSDFGDIMEEKCMAFAIRIYNLCKYLNTEKHEYRISDQLFRSGTSIGANISEAQCAISKNDFVAKVYISLKECNETLFWLNLLKRTGVLENKYYESIHPDCVELKKMLTSITKNSRKEKPIDNPTNN